jgi:hypothetical protein
MNTIDNMPLTLGLAIAIIVLLFAFGGFVWTIASIRKADRDEINKDIEAAKLSVSNAVNRLEKKVDDNHAVLHGRVNDSVKADADMRERVGYLSGKMEMLQK